jgi:RNA polymerase sigma factor (sigma-70 family)
MIKKNNINENIDKLIVEYKTAKNKELQNKTFEEILKLCEPLIRTAIRKVKYKPPVTLEELEQEAMSTLFLMINNYENKTSNMKFSNYAITYIENSLINYIRKTQNILYISKNQFEKNAKIKKFINEYETKNGKMPSDEEIMTIGITKDDLLNYRNTSNNEYYNIEEIDDIEDIDAVIGYQENKHFKDDRLNELYEELNPSEQKFMIELVENDLNFAKVAQIYNCSRENIRQKYERLITKLKKISTQKGMK